MAEKKDKIFKEAEAEIEYLTGDAAKRKIAQMQEDWQYDVDTLNYIARKQGKEERNWRRQESWNWGNCKKDEGRKGWYWFYIKGNWTN